MIDLTDEQRDLKELAAKIAADRYAAHARAWDRDRTPFPADERRRLGELGLLGLTLPEQYGGGGCRPDDDSSAPPPLAVLAGRSPGLAANHRVLLSRNRSDFPTGRARST